MNLFDDTDLIITTGDGKVQSGGFTVFNRFLSNRVHPMYTINHKEANLPISDLKKLSSLFEGFVVPIGLQVSPYNQSEEGNDDNSFNVEEERDLYDSLLAFAEPNSSTFKRKSTKKNILPLKQPLQSKTKKIKPSK